MELRVKKSALMLAMGVLVLALAGVGCGDDDGGGSGGTGGTGGTGGMGGGGSGGTGGSDESSPVPLDAALLFAPVGALVPKALQDVAKGGSVVCAGIHMSDIPSFPYAILWGERRVASVANLTREDGHEFIALAQQVPVHTRVVAYPLEQANEALAALRGGTLAGTAVLQIA